MYHCYTTAWATYAAPTAVATSGCVYYEVRVVKLGSGPQIGWATPKFPRCPEYTGDGTGDDAYSWAADGERQKAWHSGPLEELYEVAWTAGDVIDRCLWDERFDAGAIARTAMGIGMCTAS